MASAMLWVVLFSSWKLSCWEDILCYSFRIFDLCLVGCFRESKNDCVIIVFFYVYT